MHVVGAADVAETLDAPLPEEEPLDEATLRAPAGRDTAAVDRTVLERLARGGEGSVPEIARALTIVNDALPHYRRIRKYLRLEERFTVENGLLTANQKLRRNLVETRMKDVIEGIYASDGKTT